MNFLAEIISSADEAEKVDLNEQITTISKRISSLKLEVKETVDNSYIKLLPIVGDSWRLIERANEYKESVKQLQSRLESRTKRDVANLTSELKNLAESLQESVLSIEIVGKLLAIESHLETAKRKHTSGNYHEAADSFYLAQECLQKDEEHLESLDIYKALTLELERWQENFFREASKKWRANLDWNVVEVSGKSKSVTLTISNNKTLNESLIKTLHLYGRGGREIQTFGDNFLRNILNPIICSECIVAESDKGNNSVLDVEINLRSRKPSYELVLRDLLVAFQFLFNHFDLKVVESSAVTLLGKFISFDFLKLFIDECLSDTIPHKREQLGAYAKVLEEVLEFERYLVSNGFIEEGSNELQKYYGNIDDLFINKTRERYQEKARAIMKKDLHIMKSIEPSVIREEDDISVLDETLKLNDISPNIFQFPSCQISASVDEFLTLIREVLDEANKGDERCSLKLFSTARSILSFYMSVVPLYHKKMLQSIPQQSALLHNNLMYLAHKVIALELELRSKQNSVLAAHPAHFIDLVHPLRGAATTVLNDQIVAQSEQISMIIRNSGLLTLSDDEKFPDTIEKSMRQCTRQLALLHSVWLPVLPQNVYCTVIGLLCNKFLEELIRRVVATKDIRADTATELVRVFSIVEENVPTIFPEPKEVHRHVKRWSKFKELIRVLGASLAEIGERWAEGKGPLALEFTADQVRSLIKALFQVSQRRAVILSRIN